MSQVGRPSAALALLWLAWVAVPAVLLLGSSASGPLFGGMSTDTDRSRMSTLVVVAAVLALGLPFVGLLVTWRTRRVAAACFAAALVVTAIPVALLLGSEFRSANPHGPAPDPGPPVCQEHSGGGNRCPGG